MTSLPWSSTVSKTSVDTTKTLNAQNPSSIRTASVATSPMPTTAKSTPIIDTNDGSNDLQSSGSTSDPGLSTGAKAGIGVACGTAGLAALAAGLLYQTKRRRRTQTKADPQTLMEMSGQRESSVTQQKRGGDHSISELDGRGRPHELSDANTHLELEGTYPEHTPR